MFPGSGTVEIGMESVKILFYVAQDGSSKARLVLPGEDYPGILRAAIEDSRSGSRVQQIDPGNDVLPILQMNAGDSRRSRWILEAGITIGIVVARAHVWNAWPLD